MKKSILQKPIKQVLIIKGFEHIKNNDYALICGDKKTKLILRIPDGKNGHGFVLAAQFADFGAFDGNFSNAVMKQYDFAYELAYGESQEYSQSEIVEATERVMSAYACYIADGANAIKDRLNEWTFGDLDEQVKDAVQRYFGLPGVDPYSDDYQKDTAEHLKQNGGAITLSLQEYAEHKEFYDTYEKYGAQILVDEKNGSVMISFASERKWWQK